MFFKKFVLAVSICSFLSLNSCADHEQSSELKVEPATIYAAVQTAIAVVQAIHERNNAVTQSDVNTILNALNAAKFELMAHQDNQFVQEWMSSVRGLELSFERYPTIRLDKTQLNDFLLNVEQSYAQIEAIFVNLPVYSSHKAALAFNTVGAMRMIALMDYSGHIDQVKTFTRRILATNDKLLAVPPFPASWIDGEGHLSFENCKVMTQAFFVDKRDAIMYSAFSLWTMGYHRKGEFRIYRGGQLSARCFEDKHGNGASTLDIVRDNAWETITPVMYAENVDAMRGQVIYQATSQSNEALKGFQGYFVKNGNNGTVSCDTFCGGSEWGPTGACLGATLSSKGYPLACATVPGFLAEGQLTCQCTP